MPTLKHVWQLIQHGNYAFSIDLQDAYLHIPIVKHQHCFLHFVWHNVPYQWKVLPFGLATAHRVSMSLTKPILFLCCHKGLHIGIYLDDILVLICSKWAGKRACLFLCSLLVCLGLHINFSKSDLHLSQAFTFLGLCWDTVHMLVSLLPDKLADIQQLALSLLRTPHVAVHKVMSFLGKASFCTNGHSQLHRLCHVIQSDMLHVYHSPTHLFSCVHFSLSSLHQLEGLAHLQQSLVPLQFPFADVVIATDATPTHWAFCFQGSGLPLLVSGAWSGSLCRAHIALQELQAVAIMLHRMAFCLSSKVVALHLDNSTAKAYLCNQGGTVSPFLSRLACQILSLDQQTWYYSCSSIHSYPPECGGRLSVPGLVASRVASFPSGGSGCFSPLEPSRGGPPGIFLFYSVPALFHFGNSTTSSGLWVECLQPSLEFSCKLCVSSSGSGPSCPVQVPGRTCQRSTQTFASGGAMLDGGSLASCHSQHVGRCSSVVSHCKRSCHGCFVAQVVKGLQYLHVTLWQLRDVCYADSFSSLVCQAVVGATRISMSMVYQQCWKEWAGWCA